MRVHVIHTAREAELCRFDEALVVVIDALRATTVMASALDAGAARIFTTLTVDDAFELKTKRPEAIKYESHNAITVGIGARCV